MKRIKSHIIDGKEEETKAEVEEEEKDDGKQEEEPPVGKELWGMAIAVAGKPLGTLKLIKRNQERPWNDSRRSC